VGATVKAFVGFYSMPNDFAAAMRALWRHRLNCALKAIEDMRLASRNNLKCFVVLITAGFTACHPDLSFHSCLKPMLAPG
jgi:hypothetical protein